MRVCIACNWNAWQERYKDRFSWFFSSSQSLLLNLVKKCHHTLCILMQSASSCTWKKYYNIRVLSCRIIFLDAELLQYQKLWQASDSCLRQTNNTWNELSSMISTKCNFSIIMRGVSGISKESSKQQAIISLEVVADKWL